MLNLKSKCTFIYKERRIVGGIWSQAKEDSQKNSSQITLRILKSYLVVALFFHNAQLNEMRSTLLHLMESFFGMSCKGTNLFRLRVQCLRQLVVDCSRMWNIILIVFSQNRFVEKISYLPFFLNKVHFQVEENIQAKKG